MPLDPSPVQSPSSVRAPRGPGTDSAAAAAEIAQVRPRVLLIVDDADLRAHLGRVLAEDGWEVTSVGDAESASTALNGQSADAATDLALTDVMLPGRNGLELVTELRANESMTRLPIVVLTARGGTSAAAEGLATGAGIDSSRALRSIQKDPATPEQHPILTTEPRRMTS